MIILSTQERKYETKTFNENISKKFRTCRLPFPETWSLNSLISQVIAWRKCQHQFHLTLFWSRLKTIYIVIGFGIYCRILFKSNRLSKPFIVWRMYHGNWMVCQMTVFCLVMIMVSIIYCILFLFIPPLFHPIQGPRNRGGGGNGGMCHPHFF
jgi:hypothetical protein